VHIKNVERQNVERQNIERQNVERQNVDTSKRRQLQNVDYNKTSTTIFFLLAAFHKIKYLTSQD
jgi:hypothetical protein